MGRKTILLIIGLLPVCSMAQPKFDSYNLSVRLIYSLHVKLDEAKLLSDVSQLEINELSDSFPSYVLEQIFWINMYNAAIVREVRRDSNSLKSDKKFFRRRIITVAGEMLSLDDIEWTILHQGIKPNGRRKWFVRKSLKRLMTDQTNPDLLFLLNRGYANSPPVRYLTLESMEIETAKARDHFYSTLVEQGLNDCTVPSWLARVYKGYYGSAKELKRTVNQMSGCSGSVILFEGSSTIDTENFYPRRFP